MTPYNQIDEYEKQGYFNDIAKKFETTQGFFIRYFFDGRKEYQKFRKSGQLLADYIKEQYPNKYDSIARDGYNRMRDWLNDEMDDDEFNEMYDDNEVEENYDDYRRYNDDDDEEDDDLFGISKKRKLKKSKKMAKKRDEFLDLVEGRKILSGCGSRKRTKLSGIRGGKDNFTKADITKYAAEKCGVSQSKAQCVIDAAFEFIREMASDSHSCVTIAKFGSFRTKSYKYNSTLKGKQYSGTRRKLTFSPSK